ncbi:hypothetical protein NSA48_04975 [Frisingicoccus caecimuris]|nr:hypothetical protein [Frisingicoccus caecimuris]MCR1918393.1 hypothetical protein [Frisingicoccus caecimuris]
MKVSVDMNEKEMINNLIDKYTDLQRIKTAEDSEKEINYQLRVLKAKLESFGVITSDLDMN